MNNALHRETLAGLYARIINGRGDVDEIISAIETRSDLAASMYALHALSLADSDIEDFLERLDAARDENPALDPVEDTVQREIARVQSGVLDEEMARRKSVALQAQRGQVYRPSRAEIIGALIGLSSRLEHEPEHLEIRDTVDTISSIVNRSRLESAPGTARVVHVFREVDEIPAERATHKMDPWMRWAMALEMLANENGFGGMTFDVDPLTRSQARRAHRLFLALDRQDPRYDEDDWPLDLSGTAIADLLDSYHGASTSWAKLRIPEEDLQRYMAHTRREEVGRPDPHVQVQSEARIRDLAESAGAFPDPLVYPVAPRERARTSRHIWENGLPQVTGRKPGLSFFDAGEGDPRIRWGAPPYPFGILCGVILPQKYVLRVMHPDHPKEHKKFEEILRRAEHQATRHQHYHDVLRNVLKSEGFWAVAHYNFRNRYLHELVVMDPSPDSVLIIRETVPSFLQGDRPLTTVPRKERRPATPSTTR